MIRFSWVEVPGPGRIAIRPRPDGWDLLGPDLDRMKLDGVDVLVSLLRPEEADRLGLAEEEAACEARGITFLSFPITDHAVPDSVEATATFAASLAVHLRSGASIVLHCFAGIGRSATVAIATLMQNGVGIDEACRALSEARGIRVPETFEQRQWLERIPTGE